MAADRSGVRSLHTGALIGLLLALLGLVTTGCEESANELPEAISADGSARPGGPRSNDDEPAQLADPGSGAAPLVDPGRPADEAGVLSQDEADARAEKEITTENFETQLEKLDRQIRGDG